MQKFSRVIRPRLSMPIAAVAFTRAHAETLLARDQRIVVEVDLLWLREQMCIRNLPVWHGR